MTRSFSVRSNAIRNARLVYGKAAKVGVEFTVSGDKESGFTWEGLVPAPEQVASPPTAPSATVVKQAAARASVPVKRSRAKATRPSKRRAVKKYRKMTGRTKFDPGPKIRGKRLKLFRMLAAPNGASLDHLVKTLDWQKHTIRGAISTLNKEILKPQRRGKIISDKNEIRGRFYQLG